jgi:RNA polymerase sigma-70 factor (ECF subfamily)
MVRLHLLGVVSMSLDVTARASEVERAAHGDEAAFARLVATYHADLLRVAYVVCGDVDLAEDAVQSAWTIAWRKLASIRDGDSVKGWLVAVAANEARQLVRRQHRRTLVELKVEPSETQGREASGSIDRIDLVNALGHLKPEDRMLLALRYVAGFDSTEIGQRIGMSPSGTRARLGRLLGRMRRELDDG